MSERKRKRGRPRMAPALGYGNDIRMRNSIARKIQKPKYLLENDELDESRESTPARSIDTDRSSTSGLGRNSRAYNPDADHDSEYHYGSDFELDEDSENEDKNSSSSKLSSRASSDVEESDLDLDFNNDDSINDDVMWKQDQMQRNSSPQMVWLQDRAFPKLLLPKSSDDLLIPKHQALKAVGIYEILRHFHVMARLSPFRFEDFCAALISDELNVLMTDVHIALLKALIREDDSQQTHFGPLDQKDSTNVYLYFIDNLTWPENLKLYLQSDKDFSKCLRILENSDYPITSLDNKLTVLQFLCDQFLQTSNVREDLLNEGKVRYDDHCRVCHKTGDLLCCDSCSAVYHLDCAEPPLKQAPSELEDWTCKVCKSHELTGVSDCISPMELSGVLSRQDPLGYDRHGRKYWFLCRRVFVEATDGEVWYYSTVDQFEYLIAVIDSSDLEESLYVAFHEFGEDIRRQMLITEKLTDKARGNNLTCLMQDRETAIKDHEDFRAKKDNVNGDSNLEMNSVTGELFAKHDEQEIKSENFEMPDEHESLSLTNVKKSQLSTSNGKAPPKLKDDISFRLGCDHTYKNYVNQYTTNTLALNKLQHNEERDKKRHLNHKLSLNAPVEFKWVGPVTGNSDNLMSTVRQTLLNLEQAVSGHFLHSHWHFIRKAWQQNTLNAVKPHQLAKSLRWLTTCIKPVVYCPVWNDSIGHVRLEKITSMDREERKKQEKKDRKEADEESRLYPLVRYRRQFSHQLWKMKGEEYRIHGLWGWQWLSAHRKCLQTSMFTCGSRAGPEKISIPVKTGSQSGSELRGLPITLQAYRQLANKNPKLQHSILPAREQAIKLEEESDVKSELIIYNHGIQQKVEVIPINLEEHLCDGVVNVSEALSSENRFVYPKLGKTSTLDSLLAKREELYKKEMEELEAKEAEQPDSDATLSDDGDQDTDTSCSAKATIADAKPTGHILKEMRLYKLKYEELDKHDDTFSCYSSLCGSNGRASCYSPLCILKEKTKLKLIDRVNDYKAATGKSAPFNQAGTNFPIKFEDVKAEGKNNSRKSKSPMKKGSGGKVKVYSTDDTTQKVFLKNLSETKPKVPYRLPTPCQYRYATSGKLDKPQRYSALVLPQYELKMLSRRAGCFNVSGFLHNAKSNSSAWPYPCSRPSFKVMWQFRSNTLNSVSASALQLRILWSCLRWEDMSEKPPLDGRKQITTETEVITTQILKRKTFGRFLHKTQYLLRRVIVPLDVPKQMREFTPSQRSGLRKRRRAVSPVNKEPESAEVWVDEEKLCLWEVKYFGDRLEKANLMVKKAPQIEKSNDTPTVSRSSSPAELKAKLEEQLKIQRSNFNQKRAMENNGTIVKMVGSPLSANAAALNRTPGSPSLVTLGGNLQGMMAGRKIMTTKSGKIITVQSNSNEISKKITLPNSSAFPVQNVVSNTPKVLKIQSLPGGRQRTILPRSSNPSTPIQLSHNIIKQTPSSVPIIKTNPAGQQIQIVKMPDGQIQVKGLQDGQKVLQRSDGKLQLISKPSITGTSSPVPLAQSPTKENVAQIKNSASLGGNQIVKINGQQVIMRTNQVGGTAVAGKGVPVKSSNVLSVKSLGKNSPVTNQKVDTVDQSLSSTLTLRVQVKMTENGPKTIIQGLVPGLGLTREHIMAIQQQVKAMLATKTLQVNEVSPVLTLQLAIPANAKAAGLTKGVESAATTANKNIMSTKINNNIIDAANKEDQSSVPKKQEFLQQVIKTGTNRGGLPQDIDAKLLELNKQTVDGSDPTAFMTKNNDHTGKSLKRTRDQDDLDWEGEDNGTPKSKPKRARTEKQTKGKREASTSPNKGILQDAKRKQAKMQKLEGMLSKHKELLKKDILKKRAHLEKELQLVIHKELSVAKRQVNFYDRVKPQESPPVNNRKRSHSQVSSPDPSNRVQHNKKESQVPFLPNKPVAKGTAASKTKKTNKSKSKKIVCICRTAFDDTKFYVGCDLCGNWFHGDCIGISEASSRNMTEYICDDCASAKLNKELFCFCRQPYDESQFYICCERCNDWYHGKCIGIMQIEADDIDDYICPKCDSNNEWNYPCQKKMTSKDYAELKKVAKAVVQHKNAWPFLEPVDPSEVPDYYKVVKEPMDLKTIEDNVNTHKYKTLCEFVGHVMLVFDNCRAYNPPNSSFCSCASTLENFFCAKLRQLKLKIGGKI